MGVCLSKEYVLGQEAINHQLRQDVAQALDSVKKFQNVLQETPQSKQELEALRLILSDQRELVELKNLAGVRAELDSLKATLKTDPSLVLADVKEELVRLQEKVEAMKGIKAVGAQTSSVPPFAALISSNQGWGGAMSAGFEVTGEGIKVAAAGLYQVFASFHPIGFNSHAVCCIIVNGEQVVKQYQTNGGPTILYHLAKLEENDVVLAHFQQGPMPIVINVPGGLHNTIKFNIVKIGN